MFGLKIFMLLGLGCSVFAGEMKPPYEGLDFDGNRTFVDTDVDTKDLNIAGYASRDLPGENHGCVDRVYTQEGIEPLDSGISPEEVEERPYRAYVKEAVETLMEYGTDRYGEVQSKMLTNLVDVRTRTSPEYPPRGGAAPRAAPPTFPSPYNNFWGVADLAWGDRHAWQWQEVVDDLPASNANAEATTEMFFEPVTARALLLEVQLQENSGGGIYLWNVNGRTMGNVRRRAATYLIENKVSMPNAVYTDMFTPGSYNLEYINDGRVPEDGDAPPAFRWLELPRNTAIEIGWSDYGGRGSSVPLDHWVPRRGTSEWVMIEFNEPVYITSVEIYWVDDGDDYRVPASWNVSWADTMDRQSVEYPQAPYVPWRGAWRDSFWQPRGSNFAYDQELFRAMQRLSEMTNDSQYRDFAQASIAASMEHKNEEKGLFWWGRTQYYDIFADEKVAPHRAPDRSHGLLGLPAWKLLWDTDSNATRRQIEAMWEWHVVDKDMGRHNRYDTGTSGRAFAEFGATLISSFAFLYSQTENPEHLEWARTVADFHWNYRDEQTNLTPDAPESFDRPAHHAMGGRRALGTLPYHLLVSWQMTGEEAFRDQAVAYLKAYAKHAYLPESGKFTAAVDIKTGNPIHLLDGSKTTYTIPLWEFYNLYADGTHVALTYAMAYGLTEEPELLDAAEKFAEWIREAPPETYKQDTPQNPGVYGGGESFDFSELYAEAYSHYGTFAEHYGSTIKFFLTMYENTGEVEYLADSRRFARDAVSKLYYEGLFRGHPARPYYYNIDGVGKLLEALLALDRVLQDEQ